MNIAMTANNYKPFIGSVPISIERLSEGLRAMGRQATIFAPETGQAVREEGIVRYKVIYEAEMLGWPWGIVLTGGLSRVSGKTSLILFIGTIPWSWDRSIRLPLFTPTIHDMKNISTISNFTSQ